MGKKTQSEQIKFYVVIALSVVAAAMAYFRFVGKSRPSTPRTESAPANDLHDIPELPDWMSRTVAPVPVDLPPYTPPRRDIFAPMAEAPPEAGARGALPRQGSRPRLSGIMQGAKGSQALIDGRIVRAGEKVGVYTVSAISQRGVFLASPTNRLFLTVGE